jgi:predicted unusual protein kinase regulating ubiquinone biosynthesis (AarF/ABC1/UbiB family)
MGWAFVKRRMATELGPDWQAKFQRFDKEASFAASLGQVHHAILPDGREVAAKLQYPDMASALEADLDQLKVVFAIGQRFDPAIKTDEIQAEIRTRLREELDYRREARHVALYRHMLRDEPNVHVPQTVPDYSTDRLLTMSWLKGEPLLNWKARSQEERDALAINMFRAWYVPFYFYGVIHGDPHLGNYSVRPDGAVNLMDFGCVRVFPPRFVRGSIELYRALLSDDLDRAVGAYEDWGFTGLSRDMIAVLNRWAAFLYGPLMDDRPRRLTEGLAEGHGRDMAQNVFGELRRMGGVRPPREFVFMDRAAIGLGAVFIHLRASINWHRLFESLIDKFDVDALAGRQQEALVQAGL